MNDERNLRRLAWVGAALHRSSPDTHSLPATPLEFEFMFQSDDIDRLLNRLTQWADKLPPLLNYGMSEQDIDAVIANVSNKNSPVALDSGDWEEAIREIL